MENIFFTIVFISGLYISIELWKNSFYILISIAEITKRGYHASDHPNCPCEECKKLSLEERLISNEENFNNQFHMLKIEFVKSIANAVFNSGIVIMLFLAILENYINK